MIFAWIACVRSTESKNQVVADHLRALRFAKCAPLKSDWNFLFFGQSGTTDVDKFITDWEIRSFAIIGLPPQFARVKKKTLNRYTICDTLLEPLWAVSWTPLRSLPTEATNILTMAAIQIWEMPCEPCKMTTTLLRIPLWLCKTFECCSDEPCTCVEHYRVFKNRNFF